MYHLSIDLSDHIICSVPYNNAAMITGVHVFTLSNEPDRIPIKIIK